ncbi:MAG: 4-alpha-glucanotransferase [Candidatus Omnitrophica bacterium]|nr:4-alpha-glucanotransferase [Candidatus Omnitrophota bacterium]
MKKRGSGIFLHITSLPSRFGIGDVGPSAYRFADFLSETGQSYWQVLPVTRTEQVFGNSPYSSISAFAYNPLMVSPEKLMEDGLLGEKDLKDAPDLPGGKVDYNNAIPFKIELLHKAYRGFLRKRKTLGPGYDIFRREQSYWLDDYCLFSVLRSRFDGLTWDQWPPEFRDRQEHALNKVRQEAAEELEKEAFFQFLFHEQWNALKEYVNARGIQLVGDVPIYVNYDSVDVWSNPHIFKLNEDKRMTDVAGVPPDYFSSTGQKWGNPVYDWHALRGSGYKWWIDRLSHTFDIFDMARVDHFRGLVAYWEIPADAETGEHGRWTEAPVKDFFNSLFKRFPYLPVIVEDLGHITPDVRETVSKFDLPGMKVLLFAFGEDNPMHLYLPHMYEKNCVAYTSVHDTNTARGWFDNETDEDMRSRLFNYLGRNMDPDEVHWEMIRQVMMSVADIAMIPMQDVLGLGSEARMNLPASSVDNWGWRFRDEQLTPEVSGRLRDIVRTYGRL